MKTIHLIEGPVGAGKSTYAAKLCRAQETIRLDLDEWMVTLFSPDRPDEGFMEWYGQCKHRCIAQIWSVAVEVLESGRDIVLELGLVQQVDRQEFYQRVDATDYALLVHVLNVPKDVRKARVTSRNESQTGTFKMAVSDEIFELANNAWQAPDEPEDAQRNITYISSS